MKHSTEGQSPLAAARLARKWSQQEVADRIGTTNLNVSRWERGLTRPGPYFRQRLCNVFEASAEELGLINSPSQAAPASSHPVLSDGDDTEFVLDPSAPLTAIVVGREEALANLKEQLCSGVRPTIGIYGIPGAGKTTLVNALVHDAEVRKCFQDGILWVGLGLHPNKLELLKRWAALLLPAQPKRTENAESMGKLLRSIIGIRSFLLVIDDIWSLEDALVFKVGGPNCGYLVTTRFPELAARLGGDSVMQLSELNEQESLALLERLAPEAVQAQREAMRGLVQRVGGLPLALTLIGNWLRVAAASGQPRRLQAAIDQLYDAEVRLQISEPRGPLERHTSLPIDLPLSLLTVIAASDQMLDAQARSALYALSVFPPKPSSFAEEAALFVAACTVDVLDRLADAGLLESDSPGRYSLHPSIADYASLKLGKAEEAGLRMMLYYTDQLLKLGKTWQRKVLGTESKNIRAALSHAADTPQRAQLEHLLQSYSAETTIV